MIDIETIKDNVSNLSKKLPSLNIDSIFLEQDGKLDKVFLQWRVLTWIKKLL